MPGFELNRRERDEVRQVYIGETLDVKGKTISPASAERQLRRYDEKSREGRDVKIRGLPATQEVLNEIYETDGLELYNPLAPVASDAEEEPVTTVEEIALDALDARQKAVDIIDQDHIEKFVPPGGIDPNGKRVRDSDGKTIVGYVVSVLIQRVEAGQDVTAYDLVAGTETNLRVTRGNEVYELIVSRIWIEPED